MSRKTFHVPAKKFVPIACRCLVLLIGIGVMQSCAPKTPTVTSGGTATDAPAQSSRPVDATSNQQNDPPKAGSTAAPDPASPQEGADLSYPQTEEDTLSPLDDPTIIWNEEDGSQNEEFYNTTWNGKTMKGPHWDAIMNGEYSDETKFAIGIRFSTFDSEYIYKEKTLAEYEDDLASQRSDQAEKAFNEAHAAYLNDAVQTIQKYLSEQEIPYEILANRNMETDFDGYVNLIFFPMKGQINDLSFEPFDYFGLYDYEIVLELATKELYNGLPRRSLG